MRSSGGESPFSVGLESGWIRGLGAFVLGGLLFAIYLWFVGRGPLQGALGQVSTERTVSLLLVGVLPVVVWGAALHLVFLQFGIARRLITSVLLFGASSFLNSVTPFGQVGGDPLSAVLFTRALRTDFETGLAAIGSVNALNRVASLFLGLIGVGYLGTRVAFGPTLELAALGTVAVTVAGLVGAAVAWQYRQALVQGAGSVGSRALEPVSRLPGIAAPSRDALVERGYRFTAAIGRLVDSPGTLGVVFLAGIVGQLAVASTLWVALAALGFTPPFAVVLLLIPVAKLGGAAPTPGGFGSTEALLTALLMATTGVDAAIAGAAALLYRASAFWLPSLVGGMATVWYAMQGSPSSSTTAASASSTTVFLVRGRSLAGGGTHAGVSIVLIAVAVSLLVLLVVHNQRLLVQPDSLVVHTTRDAALAVLSFGMAWVTLRRMTAVWLE